VNHVILHRNNSSQLNSIATWSCSNTRLYLTDHAEGLAVQLLAQANTYYVIRINSLTWYIINKNHVSEVRERADRVIPKYTNIHIVRVSENFKQCQCSCGRRFHNGRPCVHAVAMLDAIHPQYFHPRYYKMYNSHIYDTHSDVKAHLDGMIDKFCLEPQCIDIEGTFTFTSFTDIEYKNGANAAILKVSQVLLQMHHDHIPFNRNDFDHSLFESYHSVADDDNSLDGIGDFGVPFNEEDNNIHVGAIELNGTFDRRSMDEKVFYTKMESKLRSLAKLCETVPGERQTVLDQMTALEGSLTKKALAKRGLNAPVGTLISSNPPIESSPQKKRIKGSHE
jgi:hypothetical protein